MSSRFTRTLLRSGVSLITALLVAVLLPQDAWADSVPFTDSHTEGAVGLCDAAGHPLRSGSTIDHPYVAAVGSTLPAPAGYGARDGAKATLYAFQPRRDVDPGQWSGYQLTGSSAYAEDNHPLAAATNLDPSLGDFLSAFPARWDGLVQLRIYYTAPNKVAYRRSYPAAVLRVSGKKWTVVQGGELTCDLTKVVSSEKLLLPASAFDPAHPAVTTAPSLTTPTPAASRSTATPSGRPSTATSSPKASVGAGRTSGPPRTSSAAVGSLVNTAKQQRSPGSGAWLGAVAVAVGIAGLAGAVGWRARLRRSR